MHEGRHVHSLSPVAKVGHSAATAILKRNSEDSVKRWKHYQTSKEKSTPPSVCLCVFTRLSVIQVSTDCSVCNSTCSLHVSHRSMQKVQTRRHLNSCTV